MTQLLLKLFIKQTDPQDPALGSKAPNTTTGSRAVDFISRSTRCPRGEKPSTRR